MLVLHAQERAEEVLRAWRDATYTAPETVTPEILLWSVPASSPRSPPELHRSNCVMVGAVYGGPPDGGATAALAPQRDLGPPLMDLSGTPAVCHAAEREHLAVPDGERYFMKSHFMEEPTDDANPDPGGLGLPAADSGEPDRRPHPGRCRGARGPR
ncbi:hypothetical protein LT493_24620 [Streptomyces tricolor]|nr:hypothetical protein [Streptomyces tricolor]